MFLFKELLNRLEITDTCESIFFVPGNHELQREFVDNNEPERKYERYVNFLEKLYGDGWKKLIGNVYDSQDLSFVKYFEKEKIILIGFASSYYEKVKGKDAVVTAKIGEAQQANILNKWMNIESYASCRTIACLHHNIYNSIEYGGHKDIDESCVQDNESMLKFLDRRNCDLILHGHRHYSKARRININQDITKKDKMCTLISAGAVNGAQHNAKDSFNYLEISEQEHELKLLCKVLSNSGGGFSTERNYTIPALEDGKRYTRIEDAISNDNKLNDDYADLKKVDTTYCDKDLSRVFDSTLCKFKELSDKFRVSSATVNPLGFIIGAAHYRVNMPAGDFLENSKIFLKKLLSKIFISDIDAEKFFDFLSADIVKDSFRKYEDLKKECSTPQKKDALVFLALGTYLTEFFLTVKYKPKAFYDEIIKQKANYNLDEKALSESYNGNEIKFEVNEERRALEVTVHCRTANAHKIMGLIIKEFEQILSKFEEDFVTRGFKIFYALPKITEFKHKDEKTESYEFQAYIPRLIPLLAGKNIYDEYEAFARELIQNSIDAINTVQKQGQSCENIIKLKLDKNSEGLQYFEISDSGTGMTRYVLERYLTTIGRSFYTSSDFDKLKVAYNPISQFGIGFLSCFMLGKKVEVETTHYDNLNETYILDIPNYDGCFFIETRKNLKAVNAGSKITVWENSDLRGSKNSKDENICFDIEKIKKCVLDNILNIPFDIYLNDKIFIRKQNHVSVLKRNTKKYNMLFFVQLNDVGEVLNFEAEIIDSEFGGIFNSDYGIYFYKEDDKLFEERNEFLLNDGILVKRMTENLKTGILKMHPFLDASCVFSPKLLELEVSRDALKSLRRELDIKKIKSCLDKGILKYFEKENAKRLKYAFWCYLDRNKSINDISVCIQNDKLIVSISDSTTRVEKEIGDICNLIKQFNACKDRNSYLKKERGSSIDPLHSLALEYFDFGFFGLNYVIGLDNDIRGLEKFLKEIIYNSKNFDSMSRIARKCAKLDKKFDIIEIITSVQSLFNRRIKRWDNDSDVQKENDKKIRQQAVMVLVELKIRTLFLCSYGELKNGVSIPIDFNILGNVV